MRTKSVVLSTFFALMLASLGLAVQAQERPDHTLEQTINELPVEKMIGNMLDAIDVDALGKLASQAGEQIAKDIAQGKTPDLSISPSPTPQAILDLQAKMQKEMTSQISVLAPQLIRGFMGMLGPMLQELKAEWGSAAQ
jgi:hypothetical protein